MVNTCSVQSKPPPPSLSFFFFFFFGGWVGVGRYMDRGIRIRIRKGKRKEEKGRKKEE